MHVCMRACVHACTPCMRTHHCEDALGVAYLQVAVPETSGDVDPRRALEDLILLTKGDETEAKGDETEAKGDETEPHDDEAETTDDE